MVHGAVGGSPGNVGGKELTLGAKPGTVRWRLLQGSCKGPKGKSRAAAKGETEKGEALDENDEAP